MPFVFNFIDNFFWAGFKRDTIVYSLMRSSHVVVFDVLGYLTSHLTDCVNGVKINALAL